MRVLTSAVDPRLLTRRAAAPRRDVVVLDAAAPRMRVLLRAGASPGAVSAGILFFVRLLDTATCTIAIIAHLKVPCFLIRLFVSGAVAGTDPVEHQTVLPIAATLLDAPSVRGVDGVTSGLAVAAAGVAVARMGVRVVVVVDVACGACIVAGAAIAPPIRVPPRVLLVAVPPGLVIEAPCSGAVPPTIAAAVVAGGLAPSTVNGGTAGVTVAIAVRTATAPTVP